MNNYLSDDLSALLLEQYCEEKYNANFYLFISGFLRNKGLNGLGKHFEGQHDEEVGHSLLIYNFLIDLNTSFKVNEIDSIDFPINTISDISEKYAEREIATTEHLQEELKQAEMDANAVVEFLREMVNKQRNEMSEVFDFQDKASLCGDDWFKVMLWDVSIPSEK